MPDVYKRQGVGGGTGSIIEVNELSNRLAEYEQTFINAVRRVTGGNLSLIHIFSKSM